MLVLKIGSIVLLHNYYVITPFSDAPFFFEDDSSLLSKHVDICGIRCFIIQCTRTRYRSCYGPNEVHILSFISLTPALLLSA